MATEDRGGPITPQTVALLAASAGFAFSAERCALLAPQLDWLLAQADLLAHLDLWSEEPALTFRLEPAIPRAGEEQAHG